MQTLNDVGSLVIGGTNILAIIEDVQWQAEGEFDEIKSPVRFREAGQRMKRNAQMTVPLSTVKSGANRVSHMDLTGSTLATLDCKPELSGITLRVTNPINPVPNVGEQFRRYQCDPGGSIAADLDLEVADSASNALALLALLESDDPDDVAALLALVLNGGNITVPGHMRRGSHNVAGRQKVTIGFVGSDPGGVAYPTAPVGTSTLLEKAINAPKTPLAFTFASHTTEGLARTGYLLIQSAEVRIEDARIVRESYSFRVTGDWGTALN